MANKMKFKVGSIYGNYMLIQTEAGKAKFVNIKNPTPGEWSDVGNRWSDDAEVCFISPTDKSYMIITDTYPAAGENATIAEFVESGNATFLDRIIGVVEKTQSTAPSDSVQFARFIRPWDYNNQCPVGNMGATLVFTLDYTERSVRVNYSLCKNETFSKSRGTVEANKHPERTFVFAIPPSGFPNGIVAYTISKFRPIKKKLMQDIVRMAEGYYDLV